MRRLWLLLWSSPYYITSPLLQHPLPPLLHFTSISPEKHTIALTTWASQTTASCSYKKPEPTHHTLWLLFPFSEDSKPHVCEMRHKLAEHSFLGVVLKLSYSFFSARCLIRTEVLLVYWQPYIGKKPEVSETRCWIVVSRALTDHNQWLGLLFPAAVGVAGQSTWSFMKTVTAVCRLPLPWN